MNWNWESTAPKEIHLRDIDVATLVGIGFGVGAVVGAILGFRKGTLNEHQAGTAAALGAAALFATFLVNVEYVKNPKIVDVSPEAIMEAEAAAEEGIEPDVVDTDILTDTELDRIRKDYPWFSP